MVDPVRSAAAKAGWETRRVKEAIRELKVNVLSTAKARSNFLEQFPSLDFQSPKHNHYYDFGYPAQISFEALYKMYCRHGIAYGAIRLTAEKTWETIPQLLESPADEKETKQETALAKRLRKLRFWQHLIEADKRGMVGCYSGLILRIGDGKPFREPVERVPGGLEGLVEVIPAWEGQLQVGEWETDEQDPNYGHPKMYQFKESSIAGNQHQTRQFEVHPDRVLILSDSGTVHDRPPLEPGYNALLDLEKISGAGGEGFWKNAKAAPVLEVDKEARLNDMAAAMGVSTAELFDKVSEQVEDYNTGLDKALMMQGIEVKAHNVSLPSPEYFFNVALQVFCASFAMPMKVLIGMQTGERASTEDQNQWAKSNMARRNMRIIPFLEGFLERLIAFGMLNDKQDWFVDWDDLMEDSPSEKIGIASKMADVNQKSPSQPVFTPDEIRERVGYDPLTAEQMADPDEPDDDYADDPPQEEEEEDDA